MKKILTLAIGLSALATACADPSANKPKAETSPNATVEKVDPNANIFEGFKATGTELPINMAESKVEFVGSKVTGSHSGGFKTFKGVIDLVGEKAETSKVLFEIDMTSIFSDDEGLTKHLKTADFFEVEKFPKASFVSTIIVPPTGGLGNYTVTGDMVIHGIKKKITFPASIDITPEIVSVRAEFSLNRKEFGIVYAGKADDLIRDNVVLKLDLKADRKK